MSILSSLYAKLLYGSMNKRHYHLYLLDYYYKYDYYLAITDQIGHFVNKLTIYFCSQDLYDYIEIKSKSLDEYLNTSLLLID